MRYMLAAGFSLILCGTLRVGLAADRDTERLERSAEVLIEIMETPEQSIPRDLLNKAVCVGIIPSELKGAFGVGGSFGRGALVCRRGGNGPWGAPSLFTVGGVNFGFQIGGQATDFVLVVLNGRGAEKLLHDKTKPGADASAAAGPVGRTAQGSTDLQMQAEILTYSRSRGIFAGVSLDGQILKQDDGANEKLYGHKVPPQDILFKGAVEVPAPARALDAALRKYSPNGGEPFTPK
jgi:lipid-binding SYLF domain-containing protein